MGRVQEGEDWEEKHLLAPGEAAGDQELPGGDHLGREGYTGDRMGQTFVPQHQNELL